MRQRALLYAPLPRTLEAALRDVVHAKPAVRASAARDLARFAYLDDGGEPRADSESPAPESPERSRAIDALVAALGDDEPMVREAAAESLADARSPRSLAPLLVAVEDDDPLVRQKAIAALGELGDPRAQQRLERALADARPEVRFQAIMAFPRVVGRPEQARDAVALAVRDTDEHVAYVAMRMAEEVAEREGSPVDSRVLEHAKTLLASAPVRLRALAAIVLALAGDRAGAAVIVALVRGELETSEAEDLAEAILLAGDLRLETARRALERRAYRGFLGILRDPFAWHARTSLASLGDARAIAAILDDLRRGAPDRAALAAAAAGRARLESARPLLDALRARDRGVPREAVDRALAELDAPRPLARRATP